MPPRHKPRLIVPHPLMPSLALVPLNDHGTMHAIIDACMVPIVQPFSWFAKRTVRNDPPYAARHRRFGGKDRVQTLHIFLWDAWGLARPQKLDHANRDRLDCRRENLRAATNAQNSYNTSIRSDSTSGFKGVSLHRQSGLWHAYINVNGRRVSLRYFTDKVEAAKAHDAAAREHHGEFAALNFPEIH